MASWLGEAELLLTVEMLAPSINYVNVLNWVWNLRKSNAKTD